jgi:hypothetical protein
VLKRCSIRCWTRQVFPLQSKTIFEIPEILLEEYEREAHPIEPLPPHQNACKVSNEQRHDFRPNARDGLSRYRRSQTHLLKKREFNRAHIGKLCAYFGLDPKFFLRVANKAAVGQKKLHPGRVAT